MGDVTKIEWCDHTFNPWLGCTKVHAGCTNCYAEDMMDKRYGKAKWGPGGTRVVTSPANWRKPLKWNRDAVGKYNRPRVFCGSLCDWAEEWNGPIVNANGERLFFHGYSEDDIRPYTMDDARLRLLNFAVECSNLDWLFLTKRPERVRQILKDWLDKVYGVPSNFWFGCSVSNQETADAAIPHLLRVREVAPQSILFVSYEPALGPVDFSRWLCTGGIDWVIVGGESGPKARPCNVAWIRATGQQCRDAGVAWLVTQTGRRLIMGEVDGVAWHAAMTDPKGSDPSEWPPDLRVREIPRAKTYANRGKRLRRRAADAVTDT